MLFPETLPQAMKRIKILAYEIYQAQECNEGDNQDVHDKRDEIGNLANDFQIPQATLDLIYERVKTWRTHPAAYNFREVANA